MEIFDSFPIKHPHVEVKCLNENIDSIRIYKCILMSREIDSERYHPINFHGTGLSGYLNITIDLWDRGLQICLVVRMAILSDGQGLIVSAEAIVVRVREEEYRRPRHLVR